MAQRVSGYARQRNDEYQTPAAVTRVPIPYLRKHSASAPWDPANGPASAIVRVLCAEGFDAIGTNDDFLARIAPPHACIDSILTNPPYGKNGKLAVRFIEHALTLAPVVVMLLRIDFDSGKTRTHLFRDNPSFDHKIVLLDRIVWFEREGAAGPSDNHAWFIWNRRHHGLPTIAYARQP